MTKITKQAVKNNKKQMTLIIGAVVISLGIALTLLLSNISFFKEAKIDLMQCEAQPLAQQALEEVMNEDVGSLLITASGRGYKDMEFNDEKSNITNIAAFEGKPLLVNFWATWCGPCREEMPSIDNLSVKYNKDEFEVITINLDSGKKAQEKSQDFLDEIGAKNLTLYADPTYKAFDLLKTNGVALGLPATLLLDKNGCEIAVLQGPAEWDSKGAIEIIDALIGL